MALIWVALLRLHSLLCPNIPRRRTTTRLLAFHAFHRCCWEVIERERYICILVLVLCQFVQRGSQTFSIFFLWFFPSPCSSFSFLHRHSHDRTFQPIFLLSSLAAYGLSWHCSWNLEDLIGRMVMYNLEGMYVDRSFRLVRSWSPFFFFSSSSHLVSPSFYSLILGPFRLHAAVNGLEGMTLITRRSVLPLYRFSSVDMSIVCQVFPTIYPSKVPIPPGYIITLWPEGEGDRCFLYSGRLLALSGKQLLYS